MQRENLGNSYLKKLDIDDLRRDVRFDRERLGSCGSGVLDDARPGFWDDVRSAATEGHHSVKTGFDTVWPPFLGVFALA